MTIQIINGTRRTIKHVTYRLEGRHPGFSKKEVDSFGESYKIQRPGESYISCWSVPKRDNPYELYAFDWTVPVGYVEFQD